MREIKFRYWLYDKMFSPMTIQECIEGEWYPTDWVKKAIFMQFTGLLDKNGKEIYEGDIVKFCHWNDCESNSNREWKIAEIIWDDLEFRFCLNPRQPMNSLYVPKNYEVVGNIYENGSLLDK